MGWRAGVAARWRQVGLAGLAAMLLAGCALRSTAPEPAAESNAECVILLHGLVRTSASLDRLGRYLAAAGYTVENWSYPSRRKPIEALAEQAVPAAVSRCRARRKTRVSFVTHSMGGILVRYYLAQHAIEGLGRVVMISPPNQGSELVDIWSGVPGYRWLNGPAGYQLGTRPGSLPLQLGPANFEVGVIAGTHTTNMLFSWLIPGADDGKVAVARTRLEGMADFLVLPAAHSLMMRDPEVMQQVVHFLQAGRFAHDEPRRPQFAKVVSQL